MTEATSERLSSGSAEHRAPRPVTARLLTPVNVVIVVATVAALALRVGQLASLKYLLGVTEYDDGVYFGSAVRLVHGVLPYRDFIVVQPPGIFTLMAPAALLSKVIGTAGGMAAARILTVLASTASVTLTGVLVRHRGVAATAVASGIMVVYASNLLDAHTVLVEPWEVLFILVAAVAVFDGDQLSASRRRLACAGVAAGFSGAVEAWAIFPVLAVVAIALVTSAPSQRIRRAGTFVAGVAGGFCVPVLPFAALAPRRMYQSIVASQLSRVVPARIPLLFRLKWMTGIGNDLALSSTAARAVALAIVTVVVVTMVAGWLLTRRPPPALDWFAVASTALVVAAFLWYSQFFDHFAAFLAPFLSMALALPAARVLDAVARRRARPQATIRASWLPAGVATLAIGLAAASQVSMVTGHRPLVSPAAIAVARRIIPPGACVLTDQASYLIAADRFTSAKPGCSPMVDPLGTDYALSNGREGDTGAAHAAAVAAVFRGALTEADYAWLTIGFDARRMAWTPSLRRYFRHNFVPVYTDGRRDVLYVRRPR